MTRLGLFCTLGNFLKPLATINLPRSPTFLGNFCKGVKIYPFSSEIIFGQLLYTFGDFYLVTLLPRSVLWFDCCSNILYYQLTILHTLFKTHSLTSGSLSLIATSCQKAFILTYILFGKVRCNSAVGIVIALATGLLAAIILCVKF